MYSEDEEEGRILNDAEFAEALQKRDDIFLIDKGTGLRAIVAVSLVIDVLASLWMSTAPPAKVAPDFYSGSAAERVAKLYTSHAGSATPQQKKPEESGNHMKNRTAIIDLDNYAQKPGREADRHERSGTAVAGKFKAGMHAAVLSFAGSAANEVCRIRKLEALRRNGGRQPAPEVIQAANGGKDSGIIRQERGPDNRRQQPDRNGVCR